MFDFIDNPYFAVFCISFIAGCIIGGLINALFQRKGAETLHAREVARHRETKRESVNNRKLSEELEQKVKWFEAENTRLRRQLGLGEGDDK